MDKLDLPSLKELKAMRRYWKKDKTDPNLSIIAIGIIDDAIKLRKIKNKWAKT